MVYTVTFNPSIDYIMYLPEFTPGIVSRSTREAVYPGGKGINVAIVLNQLGVAAQALAFSAGFTGEALEHIMQSSSIPCSFVPLPEGNTRINVKLKSTVESDINGQGPSIPPACLQTMVEHLDELVQGDVLVLAGSIPSCMPQDIYQQIMQRLENKGIEFAVDATGDLLKNVLSHHPLLVKPNLQELGELFDKNLTTPEEAAFYAKELQKLGARNVLVSMAAEGALLQTEEGETLVGKPPQGHVVNSVGAGDSMVAGFLAGWAHTHCYEKAFTLGLAAGSATAFKEWLAEKDDITALLENPGSYGL